MALLGEKSLSKNNTSMLIGKAVEDRTKRATSCILDVYCAIC